MASLHEARKITHGAYLYARLHRAASARGHASDEVSTLGDGFAFVHAYRQLMSQSGIVPTARMLGATAASARALASLNVFTLLAPTLHPCSTLEGGYAFDDDFGVRAMVCYHNGYSCVSSGRVFSSFGWRVSSSGF